MEAISHVSGITEGIFIRIDNDWKRTHGYFNYALCIFQLFETYLQFVGIALTNAQIMEDSRQEYERNRVSKIMCNFFAARF